MKTPLNYQVLYIRHHENHLLHNLFDLSFSISEQRCILDIDNYTMAKKGSSFCGASSWAAPAPSSTPSVENPPPSENKALMAS
mmetsp:Transcript_13063/g.21621  ORF Transcript_13063/g.21621 Transcript_13063/m.21621 type:complete len:83 (+) Transcript_13063:14-262(+)